MDLGVLHISSIDEFSLGVTSSLDELLSFRTETIITKME